MGDDGAEQKIYFTVPVEIVRIGHETWIHSGSEREVIGVVLALWH